MAHIVMLDLEAVAKESASIVKETFRKDTPQEVIDKLEAQILANLINTTPEVLQLSLARDSSIEIIRGFMKGAGKRNGK